MGLTSQEGLSTQAIRASLTSHRLKQTIQSSHNGSAKQTTWVDK